MNYQQKYIKYKNKYLNLKNNKLYGGFHDISGILHNDNEIYCINKKEIVPYKKQIIKILDNIQNKLKTEIFQKNEESIIGYKKCKINRFF